MQVYGMHSGGVDETTYFFVFDSLPLCVLCTVLSASVRERCAVGINIEWRNGVSARKMVDVW